MKALIQIMMMSAMMVLNVACGEKDFDTEPMPLSSTSVPGLDGSNAVGGFGPVTGSNSNTGNPAVTPVGGSTPTGTNTGGAPNSGDARVEAFISALYENLFQRRQETAGFIYWAAEYRRGAIGCKGLAYAFLHSAENAPIRNAADSSVANRSQYIQLSYMSVLGRYPDQPGYDYWLTAMNGGFGAAQLEAALLDSAEFRGRCQSFGLRY